MRRPPDLRAAWAAVDLDALGANLRHLREVAAEKGLGGLRAVLKADAYGHGALPLARHLARLGVERFAVALVEEGVELRRGGIAGDILVMGPCLAEQRQTVVAHRLVPTVSSAGQLEIWKEHRSGAEPVPVHVKVNTGMNRLGVAADDLGTVLEAVRRAPALRLAGLMSHLADASAPESAQNRRQGERFEALLELLEAAERGSIEIHLANSAGLLHQPRHGATVARPGLALLGYDPAGRDEGLRPVMSVHARLMQVHRLEAGERVGYEGRWQAPRRPDGAPSRIGVVPVGYADGYAWRLGDRGEALADGRRVPIVGAVSMDMLALDLSATRAAEGDEIVLLGPQGEQAVDAVELARHAGTAVYEIACGFGLRLPKLYLEGGRAISATSRASLEIPREALPESEEG